MNDFEEIKDLNGKTYLSFEKLNFFGKNNIIGNKFDDFEIIQLIVESQNSKVYKVISKINKKIYAMEKTNLKDLKNQNIILYNTAINESNFLTNLTHPHIIKYYANFIKGDFLYNIIEIVTNSNLENYISAHKLINKHFSEEELWSIFIQCMQGLDYLHEKGVIHRNIKPENILIDNNKIIKLGYLGIYSLQNNNEDIQYINSTYRQPIYLNNINNIKHQENYSKEITEYDQKIDVYYMGKIFYEMCYFRKPNEYSNILIDNINYSNEILRIIKDMLEKDANKRKNSKYFLNKIQKEFFKKYTKNTSIDSIVRCLYTFSDMTNYYINTNKNQIQNNKVTYAYAQCLKNFTKKNVEYYFDSIKYFRENLCKENSKFYKTKEIEPELVLSFLIRKLHDDEMNHNNLLNNIYNKHYLKSGEQKYKTNKIEMLLNFEKKYFTQFDSFISKKLLGLIKKVHICYTCKMKTYSFIGYFFVTLNLENMSKYVKPTDIENYFNYQNKCYTIIEKFCTKCLMTIKHQEFKQFYTASNYLIAIINRGINDYYRASVKLKQEINLENLIETKGKKYKLVGFINHDYDNEKYLSFIEFENLKEWFKYDGENIVKYSPEDHKDMFDDNEGKLKMAFYEAIN